MVPLKKKIGITETELCYIFEEMMDIVEKYKTDTEPRYYYSFTVSRYTQSLLRKSKIFDYDKLDVFAYYGLKQGRSLTTLYIFQDHEFFRSSGKVEFELFHFPVFKHTKQRNQDTQNALKISCSFARFGDKIRCKDMFVTIRK